MFLGDTTLGAECDRRASAEPLPVITTSYQPDGHTGDRATAQQLGADSARDRHDQPGGIDSRLGGPADSIRSARLLPITHTGNDQLRADGVVLAYDPDERTLRAGGQDSPSMTIGMDH